MRGAGRGTVARQRFQKEVTEEESTGSAPAVRALTRSIFQAHV